MALDFIIENNKTYEKEYLPMGTETHWEIYTLAKNSKYPLISRLSDYYSDYVFAFEDLEGLLVEVEELLKQVEKDHQVSFLTELKKLILSAKEQKQNILVRADQAFLALATIKQCIFTGHEYDGDTDLTYANARYYNQDVGKFLSQDPVFQSMGVDERTKQVLANPQLHNSYSYVANNPLKNVDPDGEFLQALALYATAVFNPIEQNLIVADFADTGSRGSWSWAVI